MVNRIGYGMWILRATIVSRATATRQIRISSVSSTMVPIVLEPRRNYIGRPENGTAWRLYLKRGNQRYPGIGTEKSRERAMAKILLIHNILSSTNQPSETQTAMNH